MNNALKKQVELAQSNLDDALSNGECTLEPRKLLKKAQTEFNLAEQKENQKRVAESSKKEAARQHEANEMITTVVDELNATLENLVHIDVPVLKIPAHLAANILAAHDVLAIAQEGKQAYDSRISELRQRQEDLEVKRSNIVKRRTAGQLNDEEDSRALVLIDADLEGLLQLIDKTTNSTQAVNTTPQENAISEAQAALTHAVNTAYIEGLRSLISQFETSLIETAQLIKVAPGVLVKDRYQPSTIILGAAQSGVL